MNRSTSRSVLAGLVVVGGLALAGCGAGQVAQTAEQKPTVDGSMRAGRPDRDPRTPRWNTRPAACTSRARDARLRMVDRQQRRRAPTRSSAVQPRRGRRT